MGIFPSRLRCRSERYFKGIKMDLREKMRESSVLLAICILILILIFSTNQPAPPPIRLTGAGPHPNISATLPSGITTINFSCFQPNVNNTPPNGQYPWQPILNVTNNGTTAYNITLALNTTLPTGFTIWAQNANYRNPSSISLNATEQIIFKRINANQ